MNEVATTGDGLSCPNCRITLVMSERQGVEIDYCPKCRGVWLDRGELDTIIERSARYAMQSPSPSAGGALDPEPAGASQAAGRFLPQGPGSPWGAVPSAPACPAPPHGHESFRPVSGPADHRAGHRDGHGGHGAGEGRDHGSQRTHGGRHGSFFGRLFD
ncbi:zf-TFIIB domain-containing protein [Azospirillum palustre]|uniref:TFIIB-type zinc ribbon-containing protein n=1 Tax=Azospirillum palustre TaxID=2044885 RepID=UPI0024530816|nr:zf-TFIIB domain-containing protein [Azospirillum palustre]